jgi:hypothetical protein
VSPSKSSVFDGESPRAKSASASAINDLAAPPPAQAPPAAPKATPIVQRRIHAGRLQANSDWLRLAGKIMRAVLAHDIAPTTGSRLFYMANIGAAMAVREAELEKLEALRVALEAATARGIAGHTADGDDDYAALTFDPIVGDLVERGAAMSLYRKPPLMCTRNLLIAHAGRTSICAIHKSVGFWMMAASIKRGQWPVAPCPPVIATYK